jgi:hypothetical protein
MPAVCIVLVTNKTFTTSSLHDVYELTAQLDVRVPIKSIKLHGKKRHSKLDWVAGHCKAVNSPAVKAAAAALATLTWGCRHRSTVAQACQWQQQASSKINSINSNKMLAHAFFQRSLSSFSNELHSK